MNHATNTDGGRLTIYPRFCLLKRYDDLFRILDEQAVVVIHAPPGCGKRRAVLQWLYSNGHRFQLWRWQNDPASSGSLDADGSRLVIDMGGEAHAPADWARLAELCAAGHREDGPIRQIIILTALYPEAAAVHLDGLVHYRYAFEDLAFNADEIFMVFGLLPEFCRLGNTSEQLFTLSSGWPALVTDMLAARLDLASQNTPHSEERLRTFVARWLEQADQRFDADRKTVLWLLSALGALPRRVFDDEDAGLGLSASLAALQAAGLVTRSSADDEIVALNPDSPVALILHADTFTPDDELVNRCAQWLVDHDYQLIAIEGYLRLKDWARLETLLLDNADDLVARLQVHDLRRWISLLDEARQIRHPIILVCAIRCAIYQGSDLEIRRYFQRVVELLQSGQPEMIRTHIGEARWSRFIAEIQLYSELTQQGVMICREWASQAGRAVQTSPVTLLQEAFSLAQAGEIARLMPIVVSGLDQSEARKSWALHLTFSIFNFWMLMLSCRCRQAEAFLTELRAKLMANKVALASAYDWLDMLALLLDRMQGKLQSVQTRIDSLQKQPRIAQDVLKNNLLVTIRADRLLMQGDRYLAQQGLHELAVLQSSATPRSYWFASAATMQDALHLLEGSDSPELIRLPPADQLDLENLGLQAQTALLWRIKSRMHRLPDATVLPHLDRFQAHLMRTGQWLRSLEVDVLRAVCLHRSQRDAEGQALFARVAGHLEGESLLGVLADPFLLWRPLVQDALTPSLQMTLRRLLTRCASEDEAAVADPIATQLVEALTGREKQVLCMLAEGLKNQTIADRLNLSITTVRTHIQHIYRKLAVNNRAAATAYAYRMNLV